jgi:hypothetical protein
MGTHYPFPFAFFVYSAVKKEGLYRKEHKGITKSVGVATFLIMPKRVTPQFVGYCEILYRRR